MPSIDRIRVLLVEDHPLVRVGIKSLLQGHDKIDVYGEAGNGVEALQIIQKDTPDVVVSDISMPEMNGIELAKELNTNFPAIHVLLLTIHMDPEYIIKGFEAGIKGYLPKDSGRDQMIEAIIKISSGEKYLTPNVVDILARQAVSKSDDSQNELTPREVDILVHLAEGFRNKEIAEKLLISVRTVDTHRTNIMRKLKVNNTAELIKKALNDGLINPGAN